MGERKVLNKYIPWNFDNSKLEKFHITSHRAMSVRYMLPWTVRCTHCGNFMYSGKKFNTRVEKVKGEDYLGIQIMRFYYKCTNCGLEFTIKTDPKNDDYVCESGCTRTHDVYKENRLQKEKMKEIEDEIEENDPMKALENRMEGNIIDRNIIDGFDEINDYNKAVNSDMRNGLLDKMEEMVKEKKEEENKIDEEELKKALEEQKSKQAKALPQNQINFNDTHKTEPKKAKPKFQLKKKLVKPAK